MTLSCCCMPAGRVGRGRAQRSRQAAPAKATPRRVLEHGTPYLPAAVAGVRLCKPTVHASLCPAAFALQRLQV